MRWGGQPDVSLTSGLLLGRLCVGANLNRLPLREVRVACRLGSSESIRVIKPTFSKKVLGRLGTCQFNPKSRTIMMTRRAKQKKRSRLGASSSNEGASAQISSDSELEGDSIVEFRV
jgi:hypothetical protein